MRVRFFVQENEIFLFSFFLIYSIGSEVLHDEKLLFYASQTISWNIADFIDVFRMSK